MLKFLFSLLLLLLFESSALAAADLIENRLAGLLPKDARWALVAVDLQTGREVVSAGPAVAEPLAPASLVKLFTAAAALDQGHISMRTTILRDGLIKDGTLHGTLYLRGSGNALLTGGDLKEAARRVSAQGIKKVTGDLVADDSLFDPRGLASSRWGAGYASPGALGLDLHTVSVTVIPTEPGQPPLVKVEPENGNVRIATDARTAASATIAVSRLDDISYRVTGNIRSDSGPQRWRFPLDDPARYAAEALKTALAAHGIEVEGKGVRGKTPPEAKETAEVGDGELAGIISLMNGNSLNVVADNLRLFLGAARYGAPGTREKGLKALNDLFDSLDLPKDRPVLADGSGVRDGSRVTARSLAAFLGRAARKEWFPTFYGSLPRPGIDGTVKDIGYRNDRFRVKGGRLESVFSLAGYGRDGQGREIAFAYMVNLPTAYAINLEQSGAEVMRHLGTEVLR